MAEDEDENVAQKFRKVFVWHGQMPLYLLLQI